MKESVWGYMVIVMGVLAIVVIYFAQNITNTEENNYTLLKETTEAAMYDAVDMAAARNGEIKIVKEKFVENFLRRFSENASLAHTYKIDIYDVNESPPKVSLKVSTSDDKAQGVTFTIGDKIDAIIESKY